MSKKIMIATGGTGGHVYPALALAQQLKDKDPDCEILFVGGGLSSNRFFDQLTYPFHTVACGSFVNFSIVPLFTSCFKILKGVWQSQKVIREFQPDVAVGFGSFYAFPPLVAAKLLSVPLILHEANSIPGKVNRVLSNWAEVTGVHFPETVHLLNGRAIEVGMPLRQAFIQSKMTQEAAREYYGLDPSLKTLLIFGGSQGSLAINTTVLEALSLFNKDPVHKDSFQVLHITGDHDTAKELSKRYKDEGIRAKVKSFEENMEIAWKSSDLVISRSGAGTIAEELEFEVPGILIPYSRAADNHQEHNADFMVAIVGGAVKLSEKCFSKERLLDCLKEFFKDNQALHKAMKGAMQFYKKRARTRDLCSLIDDLLHEGVISE